MSVSTSISISIACTSVQTFSGNHCFGSFIHPKFAMTLLTLPKSMNQSLVDESIIVLVLVIRLMGSGYLEV